MDESERDVRADSRSADEAEQSGKSFVGWNVH